ncbi:MAG: hypothetical protein J6R30_07485 [Bacteroidales bacterium]|nr:hypothetical protein [Bacteroidales bacterium]
MKTFHYIALALTALLLVTSCAIDEMWSDVEPADEQKVLTFKPKFEDFETVTKAIGDGSKVDNLLVQVYEENGETPVFSKEYSRDDWNKVQIAFYYGKTYKVYFWAYDSDAPFTAYNYTFINDEIQLNKPIKINYHQNDLAYNTLESLDAFYSVQTVNLSASDKKENTVKLTRPFAQVNLGALAEDFDDAQVSKAVFKVNGIPSVFTLSDSGVNAVENSETITSPSFTFTDFDLDDDESNITFDNTDYRYIGTTYILVPSLTDKVTVDVAIYGQDSNNPMKEATVELTVGSNKRTNLIFKEIAPSWNDSLADSSEDVPSTETDGWIHITKPEELAALLIYGGTEGKKYHICANLDMSGMPPTTASQIGLAESGYRNLTIDAGIYNDHNVTGSPVGGGSYMLKNINGLKAFFGIASDLHIQNIILDNVNISGDTHVGVLVNSLSGENTFTNVTIQNSSAETSSGAAGGMIGYVVRSSKEDRAETLSVTIDNCKISHTTATGTLSEGKFVGLFSGYDNGERLVFTNCTSENANVADYNSRYVESNEGAWLAEKDYTAYNGWLGDEEYYRGKIYFGDPTVEANRFCPKWDGETTVEPLVESNVKLMYSAFDVAKLQRSSHSAVSFKTDVDLGAYKFDPIKSIVTLDGENHILYNLKVDMVHDGVGAAFIQSTSGTTIHKDITFIGADIKNVHNPDIPFPAYGVTNDGGAGNAYAGTLVSHSGGNYNVSNVHVKDGKVYAVCKMGGLIGYVGSSSCTMENCSVDNYIIENYEPNIPNYYSLPTNYEMNLSSLQSIAGITALFGIGKIPNIAIVNCLQWWYTNGECGGLIGFIKSPNAIIDKCKVTNTKINCVGQPNKTVVANVWDKEDFKSDDPYRSGIKIFAKGNTDIAGRHVNQFIGDVVSERKEEGTNYNITISDYFVSGNTYYDLDASFANAYNHNYENGKYCEVLGCAYYVGVDVKLFGVDLKHVNDCAGTLTFNPLNGAPITVVENVKQGNNMSWVGGSFTNPEYQQKNSGSFFRPSWSYNVDSFYPEFP